MKNSLTFALSSWLEDLYKFYLCREFDGSRMSEKPFAFVHSDLWIFFYVSLITILTQNIFKFMNEMKLKSVCFSFWIFNLLRMLEFEFHFVNFVKRLVDLFFWSQFTCYWNGLNELRIFYLESLVCRLLVVWNMRNRWASCIIRCDILLQHFRISGINFVINFGTFWWTFVNYTW